MAKKKQRSKAKSVAPRAPKLPKLPEMPKLPKIDRKKVLIGAAVVAAVALLYFFKGLLSQPSLTAGR